MYTLVGIYRSDSDMVEWVDVGFYDGYECVHQAMEDEFMAFVDDDDFDIGTDGDVRNNFITDYSARFVSDHDEGGRDCAYWRIAEVPER